MGIGKAPLIGAADTDITPVKKTLTGEDIKNVTKQCQKSSVYL